MIAWPGALVARGAFNATRTPYKPAGFSHGAGFFAPISTTTRKSSQLGITASKRAHIQRKRLYCTPSTDPLVNSSHIMTTATSPREYEKPIDYRLPTNVRPTHYDLTFKTDLDNLKFWGYGIIEYVSQISITQHEFCATNFSLVALMSLKIPTRSHSMLPISICQRHHYSTRPPAKRMPKCHD